MNANTPSKVNRTIPKFDNEADEAQWWFENKSLIEQDFIDAFESGTIGNGRPLALQYKVGTEPVTNVVALDPADAKLARQLAASRGETYEGFVRRVMHQALQLEKIA
jgi:hypothetical protein